MPRLSANNAEMSETYDLDQIDQAILQSPLFTSFTAHGARLICEQGQLHTHAPGTVLFSEGDAANAVAFVISGKLQVFVERDGRELVLTEAGPGALLGELAVLCGISRSATVRAHDESVVLQWNADAFRRLLLSNANLSQRIFRHSLKTLLDSEKSMIESLMREQAGS